MKFDDTYIGIVLGLFSVVIFAIAQTFPPIPGQHFGAALFPLVISAGLFISSVLLVFQGLRRRASGAPRHPWPEWLRHRKSVFRFLLVPAALVFYFMTSETLGFILCATALMIVLMRAFDVTWVRTLIIAPACALAVHGAFYSVLHVPLPWGILESIAW